MKNKSFKEFTEATPLEEVKATPANLAKSLIKTLDGYGDILDKLEKDVKATFVTVKRSGIEDSLSGSAKKLDKLQKVAMKGLEDFKNTLSDVANALDDYHL